MLGTTVDLEDDLDVAINTFIEDKDTALPALKMLSQFIDCAPSPDVKFKVGNVFTGIETIDGFRKLFGMHSQVFNKMLLGNAWYESHNNCKFVIIDDISPKIFKWLKLYIYGANPKLTPSNVIDIMTMSDKYMIKSIYDACCQYVEMTCKKLSQNNEKFLWNNKDTMASSNCNKYFVFPLQAMKTDITYYNEQFEKNCDKNENENEKEKEKEASKSYGIQSGRDRTMKAISFLGETKEELIGKLIVVVGQTDIVNRIEIPTIEDLYDIGYLSKIIKVSDYKYKRSISYNILPIGKVKICQIIGCTVLCKILNWNDSDDTNSNDNGSSGDINVKSASVNDNNNNNNNNSNNINDKSTMCEEIEMLEKQRVLDFLEDM